jgi:NADPH:quinone reductase-like Zn-dependent oxidoreductase
MKGIVYTKSGSPETLKIMDIENPIPKANQVLIKVKASSISILEYLRFLKNIDGGKTPISLRLMDTVALRSIGKVLGMDISGIVEEVGKNVKNFKKGDVIFGFTTGMFGGWAEYALSDAKSVCKKPINLSYEQAAAIPSSGITALGAIRAAKIREGQQVLVHGSSGGVGHFAVQLSKAYGATVTGICSTRNMEMARSIGTDYIIDYKQEDFTKKGKTYDVIIGVNGYNSLSTYKKLLNKGGSYVVVGGIKQAIKGVLGIPFYSISSDKKYSAVAFPVMPKQKFLTDLKELSENGRIIPFIDMVFSVQEIIPAINYIVKNHAQGKVVINLDFS